MSDQPVVLVTGGYGCIGAETTKYLLRETLSRVLIASREASQQRVSEVFSGLESHQLERLSAHTVDVRQQQPMEQLLVANQVSHVIHLAALQTPDCNAHRDLGLQINLAGTQNLLEAMKASRQKFERFVFASSIAVYGFRDKYPPGKVPMLAPPCPVNPYGVWKLAGEELTRQYTEQTGVASISLRPGVLFGPGRNAGLTSTPTTAMKKLVSGEPYEIPFRSKQDYLYAPDVGASFALAALSPCEGNSVYALPSHTIDTAGFVDLMEEAAKKLGIADGFQISVGTEEVPFICELGYEAFLQRFPSVPHTSLSLAIEKSIRTFIELHMRMAKRTEA